MTTKFNTHQKTGGATKDTINPHQIDRTTGGLLAITMNSKYENRPICPHQKIKPT
jgi:hypothetical protein